MGFKVVVHLCLQWSLAPQIEFCMIPCFFYFLKQENPVCVCGFFFKLKIQFMVFITASFAGHNVWMFSLCIHPFSIMCISTIIFLITDLQLFSLSPQFNDKLKDSGKKKLCPYAAHWWMNGTSKDASVVVTLGMLRPNAIKKRKVKNPLNPGESAVVNSRETLSDLGDNKSSPQGWRFFWQHVKRVHFLH